MNLNRGDSNEREATRLQGRTSLRIISSTYSNIGRNPEIAPQPKIDFDEMREVIAQNLLEVQNMIEFGNYNDFNELENEEKKNIKDGKQKEYDFNMNCFDLNKRILTKGQWVDVKDTVEQWLDAQVIEVSEDNKMVKIHYNHWSTRWDEWIQTNSPRIMPFRYHTRQSTLTNYHSPYPNKKPDMGVTLLSFENLNRNSCVNPGNIIQQRNRNSSVISTSSPQSQNNQTNNYPSPPPSPSTNTFNIITNEINTNSNNNLTNSNRNENSSTSNARRQNNIRYAEPLPPIPSPKHQEPDPENHIVKNLGEDGFLGIFNEFEQINKVIEGLSSDLLLKHNNNTEILTPKKLSEIQNKSYYDLKRLIPILDRTGRIYSDLSTFMEHSMKTNQLKLLSKNLFDGVERINEDLKYFSQDERRRVTQEILSHNHRRENRSGTLNFVPPINKFETKLINSIPIIDTPYMVRKSESPPILDFFLQNNSNDEGSSGEENNNNNSSNNNINMNNIINNNDENASRNNSNRNNNNFIRNNAVERFDIEYKGNKKEEIKIENNKGNKKAKNGRKMLGSKTRRNKSKNIKKEKNLSETKYNKNKKKK